MSLNNQISNIFREIESEIGTTDLSYVVLDAIVESLESFKANNLDNFYEQFKELLFIIKNTKPRMGIVIFYFCEIWDAIQTARPKLKSMEQINRLIDKEVELLKKEIKDENRLVIEKGAKCIENGDQILIHSHSKTVMNIVQKAKKSGRKFKIILAEQEREKTVDMIKFLREANIDFIVVPEFMLSHIEDQVNKVFLGGLTFNDKYHFITDAGTNSVVAEFHGAHIPIYIFLSTKKFALWKSKDEHGTHKVHQTRSCDNSNQTLTYDRIKFSHDRIKVEAIDYIVTEEGKFTSEEIVEVFNKKFEGRKKWQDRHSLSELT